MGKAFKIPPFLILAWVCGIALLVSLAWHFGFDDVLNAFRVVGAGVLVVSAFYFVPLIADTLAWKVLLPRNYPVPMIAMTTYRWICSSVNSLLPVAQVGGDVVRAKLLKHHQVPSDTAGASVVVDITVGIASQVVFTLIGLIFLMQKPFAGQVFFATVIGIAFFTFSAVGLYYTQKRGLFHFFARILEKVVKVPAALGGAQALDKEVYNTYERRRELLISLVYRLGGWVLGIGEVWLIMYYLDQPITIAEAFMLESLGQAIRSAAFIAPGAIGFQEGGFALLGLICGIGPESGFYLSLVKRAREWIIGIPAIVLWQYLFVRTRSE